MKKIVFILIILVILVASFFVLNSYIYNEKQAEVINFETCAVEGNPVMESYPRRCSDGKETYIEDIGNELDKVDLIYINSPRPNQVITSPLSVDGEARGSWYFEGDFPVTLVNSAGEVIVEGFVTAQDSWMTEEFVPFKGVLIFETPSDKKGTLILKKDNASGLSEHDDMLEVPVFFEGSPVGFDIPIQVSYDSRIVYTMDASLSVGPFVNDCKVRGGIFNSCGSSCAPDAEICATVCAYTCELPK